MTVIIDSNEPLSIKFELEKSGLTVERQKLNIGDYRFGEYCIERKTVSDFMNSIYKRRIYDQLYNLQQAEKPVLIVIGEIPPKTQWIHFGRRKVPKALTYEEQMTRYNTIRNNMILAYTSYGVQTFLARDEDDFVQYVNTLYFNSTKKGKSLKPLKRKSHSLKDIKVDIYGAVPLVGKKLANELASKYPVCKIADMDLEDLTKIPNVGPKTANNLKKYFNK